MATDALRQQAVVRHVRPAHPAWDRVFFLTMIALLWATVVFGFFKTYFGAGMIEAPLPNVLVHVHGAAFTLWMILLAVQSGLITIKKLKWHKQLGLFGFCLSVAMVGLGLAAAINALRRGVAVQGLNAQTFFIIPVSAILLFAVLVYFAYRYRTKPAAHKRLILIATIAIIDAAVGRWPVAFLQANPKAQNLVPFAFLLAIVVYDLVSLRRVQKSTIWASLLVVVVHMGRVPFAFTPIWQSFATMLKG